MRIYDIIAAKRDGKEHNAEEIAYLLDGYTRGEIPDYQMSAWLMAVCLRGMSDAETAALTESVIASGEILDLSEVPGVKVDKHSTGGVGDKTTLVLVPLLAAAGLTVAKMSGRGLGHTGGTLDKLESIPGMSVSLSREEFVSQLHTVGAVIAGQTGNLVPADKKIYALRDTTATVESVPLIAASIMSKKIASGADIILLDVKTGSGAFMKSVDDARRLARAMIRIGDLLGKHVIAAVTDMDQPLGNTIGNCLEVVEGIETLHGRGPQDLRELCLDLGSLLLSHVSQTPVDEARDHLANLLDSGAAAEKFKQIIAAQGGNPDVVDDTSTLPKAEQVLPVTGVGDGYVIAIDAQQLGCAAMMIGAGRERKDDSIDACAGIVMYKKIGEYLTSSDCVAEIHYGRNMDAKQAAEKIRSAYTTGPEPPSLRPLILEVIE